VAPKVEDIAETPKFRSVNPATGETVAEIEGHSAGDVEAILARASRAFADWRWIPLAKRSELMTAAAGYLRTHKLQLATLITDEMGKPIAEAEAEIEKCVWGCEYFAKSAGGFLASERIETSAVESYVAFEPLGPVLAIMPWNFPFWQVFRFAAPALMAGNVCLLKHASNVPQCAVAIERIFTESGFLGGAFQTLLVPGPAAERLVAEPVVRAVTLTGSDAAGIAVACAAGRALKKCVLELGGSDPFVVLGDADLQMAVEMGVRARFQNAGQSCIAAKRFIVIDGIADEFEEAFASTTASLRVGDPLNRETQMGPLAREDLIDSLEEQLARALEGGAVVRTGGERVSGRGFFFQPTVLTGVSRDSSVSCEETFGPVAAIMRAKDEEEAIGLANNTPYGLGASIWTRDVERGKQIARRIDAGSVFINGMVASDPRLPFGGVKRSGYGRELSALGIREFVNVQTVWVGPAQNRAVDSSAAE
jgi:succinate-semialdehyde dehydrogenase/glutarate-semialdehyde dehydrogenase